MKILQIQVKFIYVNVIWCYINVHGFNELLTKIVYIKLTDH